VRLKTNIMKKVISIYIFLLQLFLHSFSQIPQLWGTTGLGGATNGGVIFKINGDSTGFINYYSFNILTGKNPSGKLTYNTTNNKFYGTTLAANNSYGVLYSFDSVTSTLTDLFNTFSYMNGTVYFANDGKYYGLTGNGSNTTLIYIYDPVTNIGITLDTLSHHLSKGSLIQASNGLLYGTFFDGNNGNGGIFNFNISTNTHNFIYYFDTVSYASFGTLIQANNGLLYGFTQSASGGTSQLYSFDINSNTYLDVHDFPTSLRPWGSLMQANNGLLYGATTKGGLYNKGTLFSFDSNTSTYIDIHDFTGLDGSSPNDANSGGIIQASDGKLYGTTSLGGLHNDGVVFSYDIVNSIYTKIHDFNGTDGKNPEGLVELRCVATLSTSANHTICYGDSITLTATGSSTYTWQPNSSTDSTITVAPTITSSYIVTGSNGGCSKTDTIIVTVNPLPVASITPNGPFTFCAGSSVSLDAGSFPSYTWSNGSTSEVTSVSTSNTYTVTVTDNNGCTGTASQAVIVNPNPTTSITGGSSFCAGDTLVLAAGAYSQYHWSTGDATPLITLTTAATYIVTVTDSNGCTGTASQAVSVNTSPTPSIIPNGSTTFCQGGSVTLNAGSYPAYLWSTGSSSQSITATASNTYTVTVTNASGCTGTASETVTVIANPAPTISPSGSINLCDGENVTLLSSNGLLYHWSTGAATQSITVNQSGAYTVTVTYGPNCSNTSTITDVFVHPIPVASITAIPDNVEFCAGDSIHLIANSTTTPLSYSWSTGASTQSIEATTGGTFTVTVTDTNGCHSASSITLTSYLYPVANFTYTMFLNTATFTNTSTNGISYHWYFGDGNVSTLQNPIHTYSHDSTYTVTLIVTNPCGTDTISYTMTLTGINEIMVTEDFLIYPNPANTILNIHNSQLSILNSQLIITDVLGNEIYKEILTSVDKSINISMCSAGVYFYEVRGSGLQIPTSVRGKFVVQK